MSYRGILVHAEATAETAARLACALDLADRFDAQLIGCGCEAPGTLAMDPFAVTAGELLSMRMEEVDRNLRSARVTFERQAAGRNARWISEAAAPTDALAVHSRAADLIVTSTTAKGRFNAAKHDDPGLLAIVAGRPVLVAPPGGDYVAAERILVCWKDTRESRRALTDALPFLQGAQEVLVAEVAVKSEMKAAAQRTADVATALVRHGVAAQGEAILHDERRVSTILQERASALGADLIVAGAYGRTRLGEWAFGGVTQALMHQDQRYVLFSH
jgi:nucleotide-binding universal stress UspA family protein